MSATEPAFPVLDASVVLAIVQGEPGHELFVDAGPGLVSTVNLAEVRARLSDRGVDRGGIDVALSYIDLHYVDFDVEQAEISSDLRPLTRGAGLSVGDRACLALAMQKNVTAYTADRAWTSIDLPVPIKLIR
ncbi:MAG TPA: type II toxin-antitoxin system VapC family toxin [Hyphomicrobiales bacterium]|nr:type II toxin-antitoxin system VapC family toxin [Hyphomicrobiales bacterium]